MNSFYIAKTSKAFEQVCMDLDEAVTANGFAVLAVHDLGESLRGKGIDFTEKCRVFEVCNPQQAAKVLKSDMALNMALPCRISVYTEAGLTKIGMIRPEAMLSSLSRDPSLLVVAQEVEASIATMIQKASAD